MSDYETKNIFAKNLSALLAENNETQAALAEILHVAASSVSGWCCGAKMPRMDKIEQIALHFGVPRSRLIEENRFPSSNAQPIDLDRVPLVGRIACGQPILAEEHIEDYVDMPRHINADFALECHGDSMTGAGIQDGDIVYIRKQPTVENGQIAAVVIDGDEATLKRFYRDENKVILSAENPAYAPFIYVDDEINSIRIVGRAVGFTHRL